MTNTLVLTGCAGFIGINFLKHAISSGVTNKYDKVVSIDKLSYAAKFNIPLYNDLCNKSGIIQVNEDINDLEIDFLDDSYDVINFASESHVDNSIAAPAEIFTSNALLVVNLLKLIPKENIRKFIQISTDEVYGELDYTSAYDQWFKVGDSFNPNNPYSASKVAQDAYLNSIRHTFGLNVQFVRMANQFGPHQHPEKMLPASCLRAIRGEPISIYGKGENVRQWTPVVQTVKVIYDLLSSDSAEDVLIAKHYEPLFNNNEIVAMWILILKKEFNITVDVQYIEDRRGHDTMYALQTTDKVRSYFETGLAGEFSNAFKDYVDNKDMYLNTALDIFQEPKSESITIDIDDMETDSEFE